MNERKQKKMFFRIDGKKNAQFQYLDIFSIPVYTPHLI